VGYITYKRSYSRRLSEFDSQATGTEEWWQTCRRVIEGMFHIQKEHVVRLGLEWNDQKAQATAKDAFDRLFNLKWTPPGRGLWMMGTKFVEEKTGAALFNCAFRSTRDLGTKGGYIFAWIMDALMVGVGVGFDTEGAGTLAIKEPQYVNDTLVIDDSREGWVNSVHTLLDGFFFGGKVPKFDYSAIRPYGAKIGGFGGTSSGAGPLIELHENLTELFTPKIGENITSVDIVDIENLIGRCVVSGNVRRSAALAMGAHDDFRYLEMKNDQEKLYHHRWGSNNSYRAEVGMDYTWHAEQTQANGEPGTIWLENARAYGRFKDGVNYDDAEVVGFNPCVEQSLHNAEMCCVSSDTRIMTRTGSPKIESVVGKEVEVWNGEEWSKVTPFLAAKDKELYRVYLSDGSFLDVTDNHEWSVRSKTQRKFRKKMTSELHSGMRVESFSVDAKSEGVHEPNAYRLGWFVGDGYVDGKRPMALIQESEYGIIPELGGVLYPPQKPPGYKEEFSRMNMSRFISLEMGRALRDRDQGLPDEFFGWDSDSIAKFFGGWIDTDGSLRKNKNTEHYIITSTSEQKLRDAQILLRKIGVNHASLRMWQPAGHKTNKGIRSKALWCLLIPSYESSRVSPRLKVANKFGTRFKRNNAFPDGKKIDSSKKQNILKIEKLSGKHHVYCFTEPVRHMGVFGNVLTYQCLVETFPAKHDDYEDYLRTLKCAYLYGKTVTLVNTHWPETNAKMLKNRRIGLSQSGIVQAFNKHGRREMFEWCDNAYNHIRELDKEYSNWLCVPRSIKMTSIKPSGTVSLLNGSTPGIHYPEDEYYIRRIRFSKDSKLLDSIKEAGYNMEDDEYSPNTVCVEFPVHEPYFEKGKRSVSMWEQLELAAQYQHYWADNAVSVTITFKDDEAHQIKNALELYETRLKAVSFLKYQETGYKQAPYEAITKEEYEKKMKSITPIQRIETNQAGSGTKYCDGESCEL
jgi:hypothetical protein